jgi:hypothetical protein
MKERQQASMSCAVVYIDQVRRAIAEPAGFSIGGHLSGGDL